MKAIATKIGEACESSRVASLALAATGLTLLAAGIYIRTIMPELTAISQVSIHIHASQIRDLAHHFLD